MSDNLRLLAYSHPRASSPLSIPTLSPHPLSISPPSMYRLPSRPSDRGEVRAERGVWLDDAHRGVMPEEVEPGLEGFALLRRHLAPYRQQN